MHQARRKCANDSKRKRNGGRCVEADCPAGSGVGVSVLLRQPHGFEGFGSLGVLAHSPHPAVAQLEYVREPLVHLYAASSAVTMHGKGGEDHALAGFDHLVNVYLELVPSFE